MDFAKVSPHLLNNIDFTLPDDPRFNIRFLACKKAEQPKIFVGLAKWGRQEWTNTLYPPMTRERNFLHEYNKNFNSVEFNAPHYEIPDDEKINRWLKDIEDSNLLFCPKMFKGVTHSGPLTGKEYQLNKYLRAVKKLGKNIGPIFLQFSENFSPERTTELMSLLDQLPTDLKFFVEIRHPEFFTKDFSAFCETLAARNIGLVITDGAGRRDCVHMHLTLPKTFVRFIGNSLHPTDFIRLDQWIGRIKYWLDNGLQELYFFLHMHNEAQTPELAKYFIDQLNAHCNLDLTVPHLRPYNHKS